MSYGREIWCMPIASASDPDAAIGAVPGRYVEGPMAVLQAALRRLVTPRGTLRGGDAEAAYGLDLVGRIGEGTDLDEIGSWGGEIEGELLKDDRIAIVVADATGSADAGKISAVIKIAITLADESGAFEFVLGVDETSIELLGFSL